MASLTSLQNLIKWVAERSPGNEEKKHSKIKSIETPSMNITFRKRGE